MMRVLLLEDEEGSLSGTLRRARQELEFEVSAAKDALSASVLIKSNVYDLMLVDMRVPLAPDERPAIEGGKSFLQATFETARSCGRAVPPFIVVSLQSDILSKAAFEDHPSCRGIFGKLEVMEIKNAITAALS